MPDNRLTCHSQECNMQFQRYEAKSADTLNLSNRYIQID